MSLLFEPLALRDVTAPNRIWMAPMCQYSAPAEGPNNEGVGVPGPWHFQHLASRAVGGTGLILTEATAVTPEGRISPWDLGIWNDDQVAAFRRITAFLRELGTVPGIQLAHAGRKASSARPWDTPGGSLPVGHALAWPTVGPSDVAFGAMTAPAELTVEQIGLVVRRFAEAAQRALAAGFQVAEVHGAHGYLVHEFLSPYSNHRTDAYGGPVQNRMRFALEVTEAVRAVWPDELPVFFRVSATDWLDVGGWTADDSVLLAKELAARGVDLVDVSTGGNVPDARIPVGPDYQVPFAARIRNEAGLASAAVGLITDPHQAESILASGDADAVLLGRELLRDPYWARHAAATLGHELPKLDQYARA
ncbi:NADH:flavin oxidoreductase/NADH oxidase [Streptacidiphilus pinicola]|uniref:NADH:flavin oxidoreductase/NADH oxidase n=1 Tax=Streptacidiphilus pinicola TaxID=2219663 RepID=A0A2X0KJZ3_9ACTN|nr:NADH:flavin oxidoreductase/NADH oxidase [Streptacidiphilus pinicola]RAG87279.1 NADH:flavin oxidoreductase/NADH oxidase [Streptacidiphilus pinicola]